jgi:hypothetical protein
MRGSRERPGYALSRGGNLRESREILPHVIARPPANDYVVGREEFVVNAGGVLLGQLAPRDGAGHFDDRGRVGDVLAEHDRQALLGQAAEGKLVF